MKKTPRPSLFSIACSLLALSCVLLTSSCDDAEKVCKKCSAQFVKEKKLKQISQYDASTTLVAKYNFYYHEILIDSIVKVSYAGADARTAADEITETLKVNYASGKCIPSYYTLRKQMPASPVSVEKALMSITGDVISNKHLAYYPDEDFLVTDHTAEINYLYDSDDKVTARHGTDYGIMVYPNPYGNENFYTYTTGNISKVVAYKEQAGYNLNKTFDNKRNPFNIQAGVLYYLNLIGYTDEEYFENICRDKNNVTQMVYNGTDTSNSSLTITFTFTYSYDGDNYPVKVNIHEQKEDEIYGDSETDLGTYLFEYY